MPAKWIASLSDGALGAPHSASLAVSAIGWSPAQARGLKTRRAIKRVDRRRSCPGIDLDCLFTPWVRQTIAEDRDLVVATDWTDFDADDHSTLALSLAMTDGRATRLRRLMVYKPELAGRRSEFEDFCLTRLKEALPGGARDDPRRSRLRRHSAEGEAERRDV